MKRNRSGRNVHEPLERRVMLAGDFVSWLWTGWGDGTHWHDPLNWSPQLVPGISADVTIETDPEQPQLIRIAAPAAARSITSNARLEITGHLEIAGSSTFEAPVSILGALTVAQGGDVVLRMVELTLTPVRPPEDAARLDLGDGTLLIDYQDASPMGALLEHLESGYNGGRWDGPGLISSHAAEGASGALGYAEAQDLFPTFPHTFAGQQIDGTTVIVRHTLSGDADLDGTVNLSDFNRLAIAFRQPQDVVTGWSQGNFNFDGVTNQADFNELAANFGASISPARGIATVFSHNHLITEAVEHAMLVDELA